MKNCEGRILFASFALMFVLSISLTSAGNAEVTESIAGGAWADSTLSNARGWNITIQTAVSNATTTNIIKITKEASSTATHAQIRTANNAVTIATAKFNDGFGLLVAQFPSAIGLIPANYRFLCSNNGTDYNARRLTGEALPQDTGVINWIEGANENLDDDGFCIQSITYLEASNEVNLTYPANNSGFITLTGQTFNATLSPSGDTVTAVNATRYLYNNAGALISTNFTTYVPNNKTNFSMPELADGTYRWNILGGFSNGESKFAPTNFTFSVDGTAPRVNGNQPVNNSYIYSVNSSLVRIPINISAVDTIGVGSVWFNSTFNSTITLTTNNALNYYNITNVFGKHTIYKFANDSAGNMAMNSTTIYIHRSFFENNVTETQRRTIALELFNLSIAPTLYNVTYNGILSTPTLSSSVSGTYLLNHTYDVPLSVGSSLFYWYFQDTQQRNSSIYNQTIQPLYFVNCNTTINIPYLNFSFRNETTALETINASISSLSLSYYAGSGAVNKSFSMTSTKENQSYIFCVSPSNVDLNVSGSITYANSYSLSRVLSFSYGLSSNTLNKTLYLLPNILGSLSSYLTITATQGTSLSGVLATVYRTINSVPTIVSEGLTDSSGSISFFLDPFITYDYVFSKSGYLTNSFSLAPTNPNTIPYTISMQSTGTDQFPSNGTDIGQNISYTITPKNSSLLNGTLYNFAFNVIGSSVTYISMNLTNTSGYSLGFDSNNGEGTVSVNLNTGNLTYIRGIFVISTATENITVSQIWKIEYFEVGDYSLWRLFTSWELYKFRNDFWRLVLMILIIVGTIGGLSKGEVIDGMESKIAVGTALIWIFSFAGWLTLPLVTGDITSPYYTMQQFANQFFFAIISTVGGAYMIGRKLV